MIDISRIEKVFDEYVSDYNPENGRIMLKIEHIKRVAKNSEELARNLGLSEEEVNLAIAIGFFHDIGRFEQVRIADTFSDKESGINHGQMSCKVLFQDGQIRKYIDEDIYDELIEKAIMNHNRMHIEEGLSEKELLFAKIIRDADKLDIYYTITDEKYTMESIFWYKDFDTEEINQEIIDDLYKDHYIQYNKINNNSDFLPCFYAYVFDMNFDFSREIVKREKYLERFTKRVDEKFESQKVLDKVHEILEFVNKNI